MIQFLFFFSLFIVFYSYIGYGIIVYIVVFLKKLRAGNKIPAAAVAFEPAVTLVVTAYNESDCIEKKLKNSLALDYPSTKLKWIFITDGSTDDTSEIVGRYAQIQLLHQDERRGKVAAMNRAMKYVDTPFVIFSDANTVVNPEAVREIIKHYSDPLVGGVSGEKKIISGKKDHAAGAGESIYWKYESLLKKLDSELYTVVGAAGELFSVKSSLFQQLDENTIIEDFVQSLKICMNGYVIRYEPGAFATESASISIREEQKRKIRIAAGAFQAMAMLKNLFNVHQYPLLSFQYISHRVLRWAVCPPCLFIFFVADLLLVLQGRTGLYYVVLLFQIVFYAFAVAGWLFARRNLKIKAFYIPYYFFFMNLSMFFGFFRYIRHQQPVTWDRARRDFRT